LLSRSFRLLGANEVVSFDASNYEGATVVHDFNLPIGRFAEHFDVVFDAGSLEHVFNVPVALANCMRLLKIGGYYIAVHPCNNFFGHGFYQFSPELYFRVFSPENGFVIEHVIACETFPGAPWFRVPDSAAVHGRVILINSKQSYLVVVARKVESRNHYFGRAPQQSAITLSLGRQEYGATA
jgi:SAM-dependent methyltransferase